MLSLISLACIVSPSPGGTLLLVGGMGRAGHSLVEACRVGERDGEKRLGEGSEEHRTPHTEGRSWVGG